MPDDARDRLLTDLARSGAGHGQGLRQCRCHDGFHERRAVHAHTPVAWSDVPSSPQPSS